MRPKITVVGAGFVGSTTAQLLALRELGDVVLVDIQEGIPQGKALDLAEAAPVAGVDVRMMGTNSYEDTKDSDVVVITAGIPRKPGMTRDELLQTNVKIVSSVSQQIKQYSPNAIVIVVSNPLDAMVYAAWKATGFPTNRVIGMAGVLDSARMRSFIAAELNLSVEDVVAFVLGGHGDTMIPVTRFASVGGIPLHDLLSEEVIERIVERTRNGGAEIVELLKTGSAYYAPGASVVAMVESILKDKRRVMPCASYLNGEYGVEGLFIGVPTVLGRNGVEKVLEVKFTDVEKETFARTADHVRALVEDVERFLA